MKFAVVTMSSNYADEFDIDGMLLLDNESDIKEAMLAVDNLHTVPDEEIYFGTNESIYLKHISATLTMLSKEEFAVLRSTLSSEFGTLPVECVIECIMEHLEDIKGVQYNGYYAGLQNLAMWVRFLQPLPNLKGTTV